jgi:CelD/BcsL family acetyltransferase involved in cellulose biosynthesis
MSVRKIRHPKKAAMLAALSELGNVTAAARLVGIHHDTHYQWMKRDPQYAEQVPGVLEQAADLLEAEARRRAVEGVTKPIMYKDEVVTTVQEYSDTLLIFLLKGVRPQKYRELRHTEHTGRVELAARPFKDLSDEDLETMLEAAKAYKALKEGAQDNG